MILVGAAGLSAAGVWWWLSRPAGRARARTRNASRLVGFGGSTEQAGDDSFVFSPSADSTVREERPPAAASVARLAMTIAVSTIVLVAAAWAIGWLIKLQLDRYFLSGP